MEILLAGAKARIVMVYERDVTVLYHEIIVCVCGGGGGGGGEHIGDKMPSMIS